MDKVSLWQLVLSSLEKKISRANFVTWFRNTKVKAKTKDKVLLSVPNIFVKEWLQNKFQKELLLSFQEFSPEIKKINYIISNQPQIKDKKKGAANIDISQPEFDFYRSRVSGLNPKYRFSNYVVGSFNQLAHACAISITKKIGSYNPLFIYSKVGLGKTHLLGAIGNEILNLSSKKKVKYIPCPNFTSEIISAIRGQNIEKVVKTYSHFDILIIDDIEFIAGKERTQEAFFRVFSDLTEQGRQIVLSSDRPPRALEKIEERLKSRFEGGMVADITFPDYEERLAILEQKLEDRKSILPREILEFIARSIKKNIRELEGALIRSLVIFEREQSFEEIKKNLENIVGEEKRKISKEKILEKVCDFYNVSKKEILSKSRKREFVLPRQVTMYFLREELNLSLPSIGVKMGDKDHTTVGYACEKIGEKLKQDGDFLKDIEVIRERIYST